MSERRIVRLGDHVELLSGFPFESMKYTDDLSGIRLLRGDNIGQGRLRWHNVKRWPRSEAEDHATYALALNDVVLAMDRPWIEAGLKFAVIRDADLPCLLVQRVARLRARSSIDQTFLRYLIGRPEFTTHVLAVQTGTAVPHISGKQIADFRFALPPLIEQQAIAGILGALDDKIAMNRHIVDRCERLAVALFDLELWPDTVELDQLCVLHSVQVYPEGLGPVNVSHYSIPAFDAGAFPDICSAVTIGSNKFSIPSDAVLLSKLNPRIPRVWYVRLELSRPALASTEFLVLLPRDEITSEELWAACRQSPPLVELASRVTGTSGSHQRVRSQDALSIPTIDPRGVRRETRMQVRNLVSQAEAARKESRVLTEMRDTLLPKLMSGEIRVKDAEQAVEGVT